MEDQGLSGALFLPDDAMHSFEGGWNNKITWGLQASGLVTGMPYTKVFPVTVYPAGD